MSGVYFKRIERKYGLTKEVFLEMLGQQESKCAICDRELVLFSSDRREIPCVDHHHGTGEVRALLCMTCNITVGYLEKDEYRTYAALAYLGNPQELYPGVQAEQATRAFARRLKKRRQKELTAPPADAKIKVGQ